MFNEKCTAESKRKHQIRVLSINRSEHQDGTLYRLKKGSLSQKLYTIMNRLI